jgi:Cof subfamily protein (haloacid dehalogenase superfamily)
VTPAPGDFALVISDVDGTLVTPDKTLSAATIAAVHALRRAGVGFAVNSSRPPRGLAMLVAPLGIDSPLCGFNGGLIVSPDMRPIEGAALAPDAARTTLDFLHRNRIETWLFDQWNWYVTDPGTAFCMREQRTVAFAPTAVDDFSEVADRAYKIVGASDDHARLAACEAELRGLLGGTASASRSQHYYLDITAPTADKGLAVHALSRLLSVPRQRVAVIGDGSNDIAMFRAAAFAVAMGNAAPETRAAAAAVTASNAEDGFAHAISRYILGDGRDPAEAAQQ